MTNRSSTGIDEFLRIFQNAIASVVASLAILVASGFVVFHANLSRYTDLHVFTVAPSFYLIAGICLLVAFTVILLAAWIGYQLGKAAGWLSGNVVSKKSNLVRVLSLLLVFVLYSMSCGHSCSLEHSSSYCYWA